MFSKYHEYSIGTLTLIHELSLPCIGTNCTNIFFLYRNIMMFRNYRAAVSFAHQYGHNIISSKNGLADSVLYRTSKRLISSISPVYQAAFCDGALFGSFKKNIVENSYAVNNGNLAISSNYISVRYKGKKGKWAVGPTKNWCGLNRGKSRGLKVYDGQRVPAQTMLVNQMRPVIFPGWNVSHD